MSAMVRHCRLCNEPMETSPFGMCTTCRIQSERVRGYVLKHPNLSLEAVSRLTNVPHQKVTKMIEIGLKREKSGLINH